MQKQFTKKGLAKVKKELEGLKGQRQELAEQLRDAAKFGDLSENFAYQETKEEQMRLETKIGEIEGIIRNAVIKKNGAVFDVVDIGSRVRIKNGDSIIEYTLVGASEASPAEKKISSESPLGTALLGHKKGDRVEVETANGKRTYTILEVI